MADFDDLYRQHVGAVFRFALRCVGNRSVAEDITSEAFLALYRNLEGIDPGQLPAWLIAVAKNRARDYWRHTKVEQVHERAVPAPSPEPEVGVETLILKSPVLKPVHRACLLLRYVYGMTIEEMVGRTGLSAMQIKGHLQYGKQLLRNQFARAGK